MAWYDELTSFFEGRAGGQPVKPPTIAKPLGNFENIVTSPNLTWDDKEKTIKEIWGENSKEYTRFMSIASDIIPSKPGLEEKLKTEADKKAKPEPEKIPPPGGVFSYYDAQGNLMTWDGISEYKESGFEPEKIWQPPPTTRAPYGQDPYGGQGQWNPYKGEWEPPAGYRPPSAPPTTYPPFGQDPYGGQGQWNPYTGQWESPPGYLSPAEQRRMEMEQSEQQAQQQYQQQQLGLQQQQMQQESEFQRWQQEEQKRQYESQLAAQPRSWLEYAAYTGKPAAVQPWMLPLMPQQYAGTVAGAQLPGWSGSTSMAQLPALTTPGAQYWSRMGPTAQQQWLGYEQARTGARPEEAQFRLSSQAPPSGKSGLSWMR